MSSAASTALASFQASISIILIIGAGYVARKYKLMDESGESQISYLCNNIFLPLLLIAQVGPNFSASSLDKILPLFLFAAVEMVLCYILGKLGRRYLDCPQWITPALMFNNTTSLPLLLARNLQETGLLSQLLRDENDNVKSASSRIESFILINAVFHTVVRFALGPYLMRRESPEPKPSDNVIQRPQASDTSDNDENTSLLPQNRPSESHASAWPNKFVDLLRRAINIARVWLNPALGGALIAIFLGLIPATHRQFFSNNGIFKENIMQAVKQLGDLIPALLPFAVGSKLYSKPSKDAGYIATAYLITIRFLLVPGLSILAVWLAKRNNDRFWVKDPVYDMALIISGAGPPAITLISVAEIGGAEAEMIGKVARSLLLSYAATPGLSLTIVAGLAVIKNIYQ